MATEDILDFDTLLSPVDGDNPAGEDLRANISPDSPYYKVKDARSAARAAERRMEAEEGEPTQADWRGVLSLAPNLIAGRSKDLEIACWLIEALVRENGFAGFRDGLRLLRGMVQNFWDGLYPLEDEDGIETKLAPIVGMLGEGPNSALCLALRKVPLTQGYDPGPFASWHYDLAMDVEKIADEDKKQKRVDAGAPTLAGFEQSFRQNPVSFIQNTMDDLEGVIEHLNGLGDDLYAVCSHDAPSVASTRDVAEQVLGLVRHLGAGMLPAESAGDAYDETAGASLGAGGGEAGGAAPVRAGGPITTREQALKTLLDVAEFFTRSEPHSFLPLMLENVVRRGRMTFLDLLADLVPDEEARKALFLRAGVPHETDNQY